MNQASYDKFIIGLTGRIGTGKSLVRKMLEHMGALTIDADKLAHAMYAVGSPGYTALQRRFGQGILNADGSVNRAHLGALVFSDPHALTDLEAIIHPLVTQAIQVIVRQSPLPIVVVEAIKLLESQLAGICNAIWVVTSPPETIYERLKSTRGMTQAQVEDRLTLQSIHDDVNGMRTIRNVGNLESLWKKVLGEWEAMRQADAQFMACAVKTDNLLAPYHHSLIRPDTSELPSAFDRLNQTRLLFVPADALQPGSYANSMEVQGDYLRNKNAWRFFYWREKGKDTPIILISDISGFSASVSGFLESNTDITSNLPIINMIANHAAQHLCEKLFLPARADQEDAAKEYGFQIAPLIKHQQPELSLRGYNLLYKQLREPLDLFTGSTDPIHG